MGSIIVAYYNLTTLMQFDLFLGTAKHVFKLWVKNNLLTKKDLKTLEEHIHLFDVGTGVGRLPHKIAFNYDGYTASQWKNWTLIYSMFCLKDLLPESHLRCWQTFVFACQYLCMPILSKTDILKADLLFVKFGERFERLHFGVLVLNVLMVSLGQCKSMEDLLSTTYAQTFDWTVCLGRRISK